MILSIQIASVISLIMVAFRLGMTAKESDGQITLFLIGILQVVILVACSGLWQRVFS